MTDDTLAGNLSNAILPRAHQSKGKKILQAVAHTVAVFVTLEILQVVSFLPNLTSDPEWPPSLIDLSRHPTSWIWIAAVLLLVRLSGGRIFWPGILMVILAAAPEGVLDYVISNQRQHVGPYANVYAPIRASFWRAINLQPGLMLMCVGIVAEVWDAVRRQTHAANIGFSSHLMRSLRRPLALTSLGVLSFYGQMTAWRIWRSHTSSPDPYASITRTMVRVFFTDDRARAITTSPGESIVWDVVANTSIFEVLPPHLLGFMPSESVLSRDGSLLMETNVYGPTALWDVRNGALLGSVPTSDREVATFGKNRGEVWTFDGKTFRLLDIATGTRLSEFESAREIEYAYRLALSPDGLRLLVSHGGGISVVDTTTGRVIQSIRTDSVPDYVGAETRNVDLVATVCMNTTSSSLRRNADLEVQIWDTASAGMVSTIYPPSRNWFSFILNWPEDNPPRIWDMVFSPDGSKLLTCSNDGVARLYEVVSGVLWREFDIGDVPLVCGAFSADGNRLLAGNVECLVTMIDTAGGAQIARHSFQVTSADLGHSQLDK